ncbi:hypothetical protein BDQ17DRAFT_1433233 [Cyathus striatus]|nr:hypothetical protein BDQ17DRAFT_1433233 [Cyathus striatus]
MLSIEYTVLVIALAFSANAAVLSAAIAATAASEAAIDTKAAEGRSIEASPSIILCSGTFNPPQGCISISVVSAALKFLPDLFARFSGLNPK